MAGETGVPGVNRQPSVSNWLTTSSAYVGPEQKEGLFPTTTRTSDLSCERLVKHHSTKATAVGELDWCLTPLSTSKVISWRVSFIGGGPGGNRRPLASN